MDYYPVFLYKNEMLAILLFASPTGIPMFHPKSLLQEIEKCIVNYVRVSL